MKKNLTKKKLWKTLTLGLILTCLAFGAGCGNPTDDPDSTIGSGDMAGTDWSDRVLDKGGANGTDNISIMDELNDTETTVENDLYPDRDDTLKKDTDNIINDLETTADDVIDGIQNGVDNLTSPDPNYPAGNTIQNNTGSGISGTINDKNTGAAKGTGTGTTGTGSSATGAGNGTTR